jgi:diguanylate cyclase (GGDEF)-like protein
VQAASVDLEEAASSQADRDTRAVAVDVGRALILGLASIAVALVLARELVRPARDLEAAARRVERGEFEVPALESRGPRELVATVEAFNDMTATLTAVEDHAVALADDPDSPVLASPLPGRTGRALQETLDRLRTSIRVGEEHRAELHELATRDSLTGLLNRMAAFGAIERDLARAQREGTVVMAIYVDLDGLKLLNDTYGHAAGDEAIRRTADVLAATTRRSEVVARLGGDEFLVTGVVPAGDEGRAEVQATAGRLHEAITGSYVRLDDDVRVPLRASLGVATSGPATDSVEALVRAADSALYDAKRGGRDRVAWYEPA